MPPLLSKGRFRVGRTKQRGVTLVELIISIVIISIASVALLQSLGTQTIRNVDPMIQSQAQRLAQRYLEEVMSKSFFDPSADPKLTNGLSQAAVKASVEDVTARTAAPAANNTFDNIYEYEGFSQPSAITGYSVDITIDISTGLALGTLVNAAATCPAKIALIKVTITDPRNQTTSLQSYRASFYNAPTGWGC